ncbi:MAG: phage tail tape measure protein [Rhodospirillaceae bacterium]|nr:phage tail tape measure protein [Rhodospirillaceae bacterium]
MSDENDIPVNAIVQVVDRVTAPIQKIQDRIKKITKPVEDVNKAMGRLGKVGDLTRLTGGFQGVIRSVGNLRSHVVGLLGPLAAIGAGASIAGLANIVKSYADYGGQIDDMSQRIGVNVQAIQEWMYAAKLAGVEEGELEQSIKKFNKTIADASSAQSKSGAALFRKLGISVKDANGRLKTAEQLLPEVADGIARIQDPAVRTAALMEFFGRSGANLGPLFKDGAAGIAAASKEAKELGKVLTDEQIAAAAEFGDELDRLSTAATGLGHGIAAALMPTLLPLIQKLTAWIKANREVIASKISAFIDRFAGALAKVNWTAFGQGIEKVLGFIGRFVDLIGGWENAIIGVIAVMNGGLIAALAGVVSSFAKLGVVLLTNPLGLIITAAAAAGVAAYMLITHWDEVVAFFKEVGAWIYGYVEEPFTRVFNNVKDLVGSVADWIMEKIGWLTDGIGKVVDLASQAGSIASGLGNKITGFGSDIANGLGNLMPDFSGGNMALAGAAAGGGAAYSPRLPLAQMAPTGQVDVRVDFRNVPAGTEVKAKSGGAAVGEMEVGRSRRNTL